MLDFDPQKRFYLGLGIALCWIIQWLITFGYFLHDMKQEEKDAINAGHDKTGSSILSSNIRQWYFDKIRPFEEYFIKHRFTPNQLTVLGCSFSVLAAVLYHFGWIGCAGWIVLVSGTFDIIDGLVARKTNQASKSGAFFDSVLDRYAEMIVYIGILSYSLRTGRIYMVWIVLAAMVGAQMVSYTRARAESVGVTGKVGIMQRPERYVFLGFGSFFSTYYNGIFSLLPMPNHIVFIATVAFIALMSNYTAYKRFQTAFVALRGAR